MVENNEKSNHIRWGPISEFKLTDKFVEQYSNNEPEWGPIGKIVYYRTYSRPLEDGKTEEYWQTLQRVVEGTFTIQKTHCDMFGLPWNQLKAQKSAQALYDRMWNFKFLPPGRGLWAMGSKYIYERGSAPLNNCAFISFENIATECAEPFCFVMDMSMLGVGVGFDTVGAGKIRIRKPKKGKYVFVVEDSREGWVELIRVILNSYFGIDVFPENIDYSKIRPTGAPLKGFGGLASGSKPLEELVENIQKTLEPLIDETITSVTIVDICNFIGRCVVAGNVRRSAELALGDANDLNFLEMKDSTKYKKELMDRRWASNNSIFVTRGTDYSKVTELTMKNGEPGYFWLENAQAYGRLKDGKTWTDSRVKGCNPCSEQTLESYELCCLVECFPSLHKNKEEFFDTLKYAYLYAKTVTLLPTHNQRTNAVMLRNRRIGTSVSGIVQAFNKHGRRNVLNWFDDGYKKIREWDKTYSQWLCIPESIKVTTVKPSGSISQLPGVTPGIHYPHSQYYIRNVRFSTSSPFIELLKKAGYGVEKDKYSPNTVVVSFPVKEQFYNRCKKDVSIWEQLENAAQLQAYWSDNSVSATVTFKKEEAKDIKQALELYETRLKSISFLPIEHDYEQAPYIEITEEQYEKMVGGIKKNFKLKQFSELDSIQGGKFCDNSSCHIDV